MKLSEIGEFGFIDRIKKGCLLRPSGVIKGIGDDCCVFKDSEGAATVLTTDLLVETIHFLLDRIPPYLLGRKSMAVNLSDIAAMGADPREAVISIAVPGRVPVETLDAIYDGMKSMAKEFDVNLLGGDTTSAPEHLVINIAMVGEAPEEEILYRSGAKAGDRIFLTGRVGSSAAGLDILLTGRKFEGASELVEAHNNPSPHVKAGRAIAKTRLAHSLIDVSDGVASDLGHICEQSGLGAEIEKERIPVASAFTRYVESFALDFERLALHVGEDYVLLGTVPESSAGGLERALHEAGCEFFPIGAMVAGKGIRMKNPDGTLKEIKPAGFDHFKG
jgi:thiamine-monophosphate kinase